MTSAFIVYYYKKKFVNFGMKSFHEHNRVEIMYVSSGQCFVDTPLGRKVLDTGKFIILGESYPHSLCAGNADIVNLEFHLGNNNGFDVSRTLEVPGVAEIFTPECEVYTDDGTVYPALRDVVKELQTQGEDVMVEALMHRLFVTLGRFWERTRKSSGGMAYVKKAQDYIAHHSDEKITVAAVADHVGINHSYLQTLFRTHSNTTITEYANKLRIEKACFLLRNTDMDTTDIAMECGFASRQHFGLTFRNIMRCSPIAFRKAER